MNTRILIVDDEPEIVDGLEILLSSENPDYQVVGKASDGLNGCEMALDLQPDIIITDIRMPLCNGLDMIRDLKNNAGFHTDFIIISGYAEFEYARRAMEYGVRIFLTKPIDEEELFAAIEKMNRERKVASLIPEESVPVSKDVIAKAKEYIREHFSSSISLTEVADHFSMNSFYFSQLFKKKTGETYQKYITDLRMKQAQILLRTTDMKIYEICEEVGYIDTNYFSRLFEKNTGMKPSAYRMAESRKKTER